MALIKCKECGAKVSTKAKTCPQCGAKLKKGTSKLILGLLGLTILGMYLSVSTGHKDTSVPPTKEEIAAKQALKEKKEQQKLEEQAEHKRKDEDWTSIAAAKNIIKKRLRDPDSAEFKNLIAKRRDGKIFIVCGEVNAKNGFGGMTGFQPFMSFGSSEMTWLPSDSKDFATNWNKFCAGKL